MGSARGNPTNDAARTHETASWFPIVGAVFAHPGLWLTALRQARRSVPPQWWRRPPFLPRPDAAYVRFRMETAFGVDGHPQPDDVVRWLRWCRDEQRSVNAAH